VQVTELGDLLVDLADRVVGVERGALVVDQTGFAVHQPLTLHGQRPVPVRLRFQLAGPGVRFRFRVLAQLAQSRSGSAPLVRCGK
jgi:hypothetical protein